jgi:hypothetical protein
VFLVRYELGSWVPEDDIHHSHCREDLKSYKVPVGLCSGDVSPVRYEMCSYIPEDGILHRHCREHLKYCKFLKSLFVNLKSGFSGYFRPPPPPTKSSRAHHNSSNLYTHHRVAGFRDRRSEHCLRVGRFTAVAQQRLPSVRSAQCYPLGASNSVPMQS